MTLLLLAKDYLRKVQARREALQLLFRKQSYDDVVREAQEIVELAFKGSLRCLGIEPSEAARCRAVLGQSEGIAGTLAPSSGNAERDVRGIGARTQPCLLRR